MVEGKYPPAFPLKHQQKDLRWVRAGGRSRLSGKEDMAASG